MVRRWLVVACALLPGCYLEMWGGYYPISSARTEAPGRPVAEVDGPSYSIGASVGLWLDHWGLGVGLSGAGISPEAVVVDLEGERTQKTTRSDRLRLDVDLPVTWWNPWFIPRATFVIADVDSVDGCLSSDQSCSERTDLDARGRSLFGGLTATFVSRSFAGSLGLARVALEHDASAIPLLPATAVTAWGPQVRLLVKFEMGLELMQYYTPSVIRPIPPPPPVCSPGKIRIDCWP